MASIKRSTSISFTYFAASGILSAMLVPTYFLLVEYPKEEIMSSNFPGTVG
jgi:hypothetical protein